MARDCLGDHGLVSNDTGADERFSRIAQLGSTRLRRRPDTPRAYVEPVDRGTSPALPRVVLKGSGRAARSGRHRGVRIAHIGGAMLAEGGLIEPGFRKRDEEKFDGARV